MKGLVIVGTEVGSVYIYGGGYQNNITLAAPLEITHICCLREDKILVSFRDNSLVIYSLPTLLITSELDAKWMHSRAGEITSICVEEFSDRNYTYIGTSAGFIFVLDTSGATFRISDYMITPKDAGVSADMIISQIEISPRVSLHSAAPIHMCKVCAFYLLLLAIPCNE